MIVQPVHSQKLIDELGPMRGKDEPMTPRHDNIAKSLQVVTEEIILHLLNRLHAKTKCDRLCMTGGVAMNSVANGKITTHTPFKEVYIPAGAADNGTSFGAAFYVWNTLLGQPRTFVQDHAYWGCESSHDECAAAAEKAGVPHEQLSEQELLDQTTDQMIDGNPASICAPVGRSSVA